MIPYKIGFSKKSEAEFFKLPKEIQIRISKKLKIAQVNPFLYFIHLKGRSDHKLRIGDYRIIADINQIERTIEITKAGHRREVYKNS
ncbi:type II toxin-antitoxin system RelE/ParE family toxin [Candidatus Woesearchaeota archaeon]|nr:type II toxin-antitoxin system RelE/ParE family toxin [Candidatus Woesearchaeota archaeon]